MENIQMKCEYCGWGGFTSEAYQASNLSERLDYGDLYTELECPKCGMLVYPADVKTNHPFIAADDRIGWGRWLMRTIGRENASAVVNETTLSEIKQLDDKIGQLAVLINRYITARYARPREAERARIAETAERISPDHQKLLEDLLLRQKPDVSPDHWSVEAIAAYIEWESAGEFAGIVYELEPKPRLVEDKWEPVFFRDWVANQQ